MPSFLSSLCTLSQSSSIDVSSNLSATWKWPRSTCISETTASAGVVSMTVSTLVPTMPLQLSSARLSVRTWFPVSVGSMSSPFFYNACHDSSPLFRSFLVVSFPLLPSHPHPFDQPRYSLNSQILNSQSMLSWDWELRMVYTAPTCPARPLNLISKHSYVCSLFVGCSRPPRALFSAFFLVERYIFVCAVHIH